MASLTEKNIKEFLVDVKKLDTMKVVEETVHVDKPIFEEKIVEVPIFKEVEVEKPIFKEKEVVVYVLKEKSLANAMKPVIAEIQMLEKHRADLGEMIATAVEDAVMLAFARLVGKLK
jgi:hypothetical protein